MSWASLGNVGRHLVDNAGLIVPQMGRSAAVGASYGAVAGGVHGGVTGGGVIRGGFRGAFYGGIGGGAYGAGKRAFGSNITDTSNVLRESVMNAQDIWRGGAMGTRAGAARHAVDPSIVPDALRESIIRSRQDAILGMANRKTTQQGFAGI